MEDTYMDLIEDDRYEDDLMEWENEQVFLDREYDDYGDWD